MTSTPDSSRILVGVDGSSSSVDALAYAFTLADALGAPLEAVTTWAYSSAPGYVPPPELHPEDDAAAILDTAINEAFPDGPPPITRTVLCGSPARTLIEQSADAHMLVLGSRGHGGFAGLLLGSVSSACAEHAHCPVLIVHSPEHRSEPSN